MDDVRRDWLFVGCEAGHDWRSLGGCNAGCHNECSCSVPVNFCRRSGDCDYGDNTEAEQCRIKCAALWGDPKTRWAASLSAIPPNPSEGP